MHARGAAAVLPPRITCAFTEPTSGWRRAWCRACARSPPRRRRLGCEGWRTGRRRGRLPLGRACRYRQGQAGGLLPACRPCASKWRWSWRPEPRGAGDDPDEADAYEGKFLKHQPCAPGAPKSCSTATTPRIMLASPMLMRRPSDPVTGNFRTESAPFAAAPRMPPLRTCGLSNSTMTKLAALFTTRTMCVGVRRSASPASWRCARRVLQ